MKITRQQIGKIQVAIGIIILITTLFGTYWVMNYYYLLLSNGGLNLATVWYDVGSIQNEGSEQWLQTAAQSMTGNVLLAQIYQTTRYLFGLGAVVLGTLSITLVLQGLANQK
jgi:hypothetical protein